MQLPDTLDDELINILGRPNFICGQIASAMRQTGADIPRKAEVEQAHVIFKLLQIYAEHGPVEWMLAASQWIDGMIAQIAAKEEEPTTQ
jgi:hypothetical protein